MLVCCQTSFRNKQIPTKHFKKMAFSLNKLEQFVSNLKSIEHIYQTDKPRFQMFLDKIPFDKCLNINIFDGNMTRNYIKILKFLIVKPELYKKMAIISDIIQFIFINITFVNEPYDKDVFLNLLQILEQILSGLNSFQIAHQSLINKKQVFDIILTISEKDLFNKTALKSCIHIMSDLLLDAELPESSTEKVLTQVFRKCKNFNAVIEICHIIDILLNSLGGLTDDSSPILEWIYEESYSYLNTKKENLNIIQKLIPCLTTFLNTANYSESDEVLKESYQNFLKNLMTKLGSICTFCCNENMRSISIKFLFTILKIFTIYEIPFLKLDSLYDELYNLPLNLKLWPKTGTLTFFYVCHFLCIYDKLLWEPKKILDSIASVFYNSRFVSDAEIKVMCFLYSVVYVDCVNPSVLLLGEDLIKKFSKSSNLSFIYTYHVAQLVWILSSHDEKLKIVTVTQWLNKKIYDKTILKVVKYCSAGQILLDILIHNYDSEIGCRASNIIKKLQNYEISVEIAYRLPSATCRSEKLYKLLMLSEPAVPKTPHEALYLVKFMGVVIVLFKEDEELIKLSCVYSIKLINSLKNESSCAGKFCKGLKNIVLLLTYMVDVSDETCVEIIRLMLILIRVQVKFSVKLEQIQYDFTNFLIGTDIKIKKGLELVHTLLCYEHRGLFLCLHKEKLLDLTFELIHICSNQELAALAYKCLVFILNNNFEIATDNLLIIHIELQCMLSANLPFSREFLKFVGLWMNVIKKFKMSGFIYIPETTIRSYILRSSIVMDLRVNRYLKLLNSIVNEDSEI